jgi:Xaa-Pro dipeptidase
LDPVYIRFFMATTMKVPVLPFSLDEYQVRLRKTLELMEREKWDVLLCYSSRVYPGTVRYLTGYESRLGIHDAAYLLLDPGANAQALLFSNASWEHPEEESWVQNAVITSNFGQEIAARLSAKHRRIGVVGFRYLPSPVFASIQHRFSDLEIVDATEPVVRLRSVKSEAEIEILRRVTSITDLGGQAFLDSVCAGVDERSIAADVEYAMKRGGSDEVSFTTQVGCGERSSRVVVYPGKRVLREGDPVQLDCGATTLGYRGDLSRVAVVGRPSQQYADMLETCAEMYFRCVEELKPGVRADHIAKLGIEIARSHKLDEYLYRSPNHEPGFMGHGIGTHYSEFPELHPDDHTTLQENMVLVIEPILMRPGVGGVKIEDSVLLRSAGAERLSKCEITTWKHNRTGR